MHGTRPLPSKPPRDARVDLLRGFALLTIFVDHAPGNFLGLLTLRNFGFCDAAELFVILAGFSATLAYGKIFERDGIGSGLRRVGARCLRLYVFQAGLLLATLFVIRFWLARFGLDLPDLAPFLDLGMTGVRRGLALQALPSNVDILPLYIVLLGLFPITYAGIRINRPVTLVLSAALWTAANAEPRLNITNYLDGRGWFFNPFAWQFLFVLGACGASVMAARGGSLPRVNLLVAVSWAYLGFALLATAPWADWGLSDFRPIALAAPDKTNLAPLRLVDVLALVYLALSSHGFGALARQRWCSGIVACGRHSLEVFSLGTLLSLMGRLLFATFGTSLFMQIAIDGIGLGAMLALAFALERNSPRGRGVAVPAAGPPR